MPLFLVENIERSEPFNLTNVATYLAGIASIEFSSLCISFRPVRDVRGGCKECMYGKGCKGFEVLKGHKRCKEGFKGREGHKGCERCRGCKGCVGCK